MIRDCNCEVGLNVKCVFRKRKHKICNPNAGKIIYIIWLFYNCGCLTMKFFRSELTSAAPIPEFGRKSLIFLMENNQPTGSCIDVCGVDTSRRTG